MFDHFEHYLIEATYPEHNCLKYYKDIFDEYPY